MGLGEAIKTCFRKYVTFSGRARRSEYWYFILFSFLVSIPAAILDELAAPAASSRGPFSSALSLALFLPQLAVLTRRLHDTNKSGFWILGLYGALFAFIVIAVVAVLAKTYVLAIIPGVAMFAYVVWIFVLTVMKGTEGPNDYGPDPFSETEVSTFD